MSTLCIAEVIQIRDAAGDAHALGASEHAYSRNASPTEENRNPDLPPPGTRSLFDYLFSDGIPYPFEKVLDKISQNLDPNAKVRSNGLNPRTLRQDMLAEGNKPLAVLFPFSRSLQRKFVSPKFPRIVMTVDGYAKATPEDLGLSIQNKLYIGYSEKANQLEIISYNEGAGRFEFQILKNYGVPGKNPELLYAKREFCMACHQNGGPIFPRGPWTETNDPIGVRPTTRKSITDVHGTQITYHGVEIAPANRAAYSAGKNHLAGSDKVDGDSSYRFQNAAQDIQALSRIQFLWNLCAQAGQSKFGCRAEIMKYFILTNGYEHLRQAQNYLNTGLDPNVKITRDYYDSFLEDFDPLRKSTDSEIQLRPTSVESFPNRDDLSADTKKELNALVGGSVLPPEFEPLNRKVRKYEDSLEEILRVLEHATLFSPSDKELIGDLFGHSRDNLDAAISQLQKEAVNGGKNSLSAAAIPREAFLADLLRLKGKPPPLKIRNTGEKGLPVAKADGLGPNDRIDFYKTPKWQPFIRNCASCHSDGELSFLNEKTKEAAEAKLKEWAPRILKALDWNSVPPPGKLMPPRQDLRRKITDQEREQMLKVIKLLDM